MKPITLNEIATACGGRLFADGDLTVTSIVTDSRKISNGSMFVAIKGERVDGHSYIKQCMDAGAVCALCEDAPNFSCNYILVESTLETVKKSPHTIARCFLSRSSA